MRGRGWRRLALAAMLAGLALSAAAREPEVTKRVVRGQVLDAEGKAVATAIVHLKNLSTQSALSVVTDKEGRYRFNELDKKTDYEVFAEWQEQKSRPRKISQFDTRNLITLNLTLEPAKDSGEKDKAKPSQND